MSEDIVVDMVYKKSTAGTHVFEGGVDSNIPTLYIKKKAFESETPKSISITVKY
jgi:hypothetical protein